MILIIVILGESHLTSKIDKNDLKIDDHRIERCGHLDDMSRGGKQSIISHPFLLHLNLD